MFFTTPIISVVLVWTISRACYASEEINDGNALGGGFLVPREIRESEEFFLQQLMGQLKPHFKRNYEPELISQLKPHFKRSNENLLLQELSPHFKRNYGHDLVEKLQPHFKRDYDYLIDQLKPHFKRTVDNLSGSSG
ncbi:unnamed protein product [Enterobius vermicularis]|uniref:Uncharacterized protein n=1 Tax=Enterobius vermicularis TaxID=51028 RepID=A0A0N4UWJ3_ENTVE|nr:unnamed protein product [Enterobius vermicularis]